MNNPTLPPRPYSEADYDRVTEWLANRDRYALTDTRRDITLAPDDYRVIAVNDPARQAVQ